MINYQPANLLFHKKHSLNFMEICVAETGFSDAVLLQHKMEENAEQKRPLKQ